MSSQIHILIVIILVLVQVAVLVQSQEAQREAKKMCDDLIRVDNLPSASRLDDSNSRLDGNATRLNYRALVFSDDLSQLYIGGRERLLIVNTADMSVISSISVSATAGAVTFCRTGDNTDEEAPCFNYVVLIEELDDNSLFVCGTDSLFKKCYYVNKPALTLVDADVKFTRDSQVPSRPDQTLIYLEKDSRLFSGVGIAGEPSGDWYFRLADLDGYNTPYDDATDVKSDEDPKALNNPEFVGEPIEYNGYIYFFFREYAAEHINAGKIVFSRVGRVCKTDQGGNDATVLVDDFTTYQKARLDCSYKDDSSDFTFMYNDIQDIYQVDKTIFAVFATPSTPAGAVTSSAVCVYNLDEIAELFDKGEHRGQPDDTKQWGPPPSTSPLPSDLFKCTGLPFPESEYNNIRTYPLMNTLVPNKKNYKDTASNSYLRTSDSALLIKDNVRFLQVVVVENAGGEDEIFLGTDRGTIIKATLSTGSSPAKLLKEVDLNMGEAVDPVLTMVKNGNSIYVGTDNSVYGLEADRIVCPTPTPTPSTPPGQECLIKKVTHTESRTVPPGMTANIHFVVRAPKDCDLTVSDVVCNCSQDFEHSISRIDGDECIIVVVNIAVNSTENCLCRANFTTTGDTEVLETSIVIDKSPNITKSDCMEDAKKYDNEISKYKFELNKWKNNMIQNSGCANQAYCSSENLVCTPGG